MARLPASRLRLSQRSIRTVSYTHLDVYKRQEFIRTAATAGAVVYQVDARLPALIPVFFAGQLSAVPVSYTHLLSS